MKSLAPPLDGSLPPVWGILDWRADHTPSDPWMVFQSPESPNERKVLTFAECAMASHRAAYGLRRTRLAAQEGTLVAMLLDSDTVHYMLLLTGLMRAGFIPLPISITTPPEMIFDILRAAKCHKMVTPSTASMYFFSTSIKHFCDRRQYPMRVDEAPSLDFILPQLKDPLAKLFINEGPYPTSETRLQPSDVVLYVQTPLSSVIQDPIPLTHQDISDWQKMIAQKAKGVNATLSTMCLPPHSSFGILMQLLMPLATGIPVGVLPPAHGRHVLPSPPGALEMAAAIGCTGMITTSAYLEAWATCETACSILKRMKMICYAGKKVRPCAEIKLSLQGVHFTLFGTETSLIGLEKAILMEPDESNGEIPPEANPLIYALRKHGASIVGNISTQQYLG